MPAATINHLSRILSSAKPEQVEITVAGKLVFVRVVVGSGEAGGAGNIQMVSPMLTHWNCPACGSDYETGGIGVMNLQFVDAPEPASALMLLAGISALGLIYRVNHRG